MYADTDTPAVIRFDQGNLMMKLLERDACLNDPDRALQIGAAAIAADECLAMGMLLVQWEASTSSADAEGMCSGTPHLIARRS
jgi:hypothetical protein